MVRIFAKGTEFDISAVIRREICLRLSKNSDRNIIFIVPDQFEFETEKAVYNELFEKKLLTKLREIHIETFSSLSKKILAEACDKRINADDTIKNILMHKAVRDQKTALSSLSRQAEKAGFCKKMLATVSMLKSAGLSANLLDETTIRKNADKNERLKTHIPVVEKLCDVSKIQTCYEGYMSRYIDKLDSVSEAARILSSSKSSLFDNADVFVDCFNDFTGSQLQFIMKLTQIADNLTLGFSIDYNSNRELLFAGLQSQIDKIIGYAKENDIETEVIEDDFPRRFAENSPLSELSRNIFSEKKSRVKADDNIEIIHASDTYEEIDFTAAKIKEFCLDKGYLYREIAVLCANSSYGKYIKNAFEKYEIPYFLDIPEPILFQPLVNFFLALLNVLRDFSVENALSLIKTNFMSKNFQFADENEEISTQINKKIPLSKKDIDTFESFIFEWNLQAKHLKKPFNHEKSPNAEYAEMIRNTVIEPVLKLKKSLGGKDGAEITRMIYDYAVNEIEIERSLFSRCLKQNSGEINTELLRVNQQLWDSIAKILETLERELQGEYISLDEYYRFFSDICAGTVLAKPPQYQDCVLVGDIDRTRANGIKVAFIVGATYDNFPTAAEGTGVFSENETEFLRNNIQELGLSDLCFHALKSTKEQYCLSLYRAYKALSLPTNRLEIVFSDYNEKGDEQSRSQIVGDILSIFPDSYIQNAEDFDDKFYCRSIKSAKQRYANKLHDNSAEKSALESALKDLSCGDFVEKLDNISMRKYQKNSKDTDKIGAHHLNRETAQRLFERNLGATSAEKLNLCKFRYFCEFGLKIKEKNQRIFNAGNRGNAIHYVLQKILEKYCLDMSSFFSLTRNELIKLALFYINEYCTLETNGDFDDDKRTKYLFYNLANAAADVLITLQAEFSAREYRPKFFELSISENAEIAITDNIESEQIYITEAVLNSDNSASDNTENNAKSSDKLLYVKPLEIKLDDGSIVKISGRIDRIDMFFSDEKSSYIRVIDYKFTSKGFDVQNAKFGVNIQMLLYLFALCDANKTNDFEVLPGGISYIPSASSGAIKDKFSAFRLLAMNHHPNGLYVRDENTDIEAKNYADFLLKKITSEEESIDNILDEKTKKAVLKSILPDGENAPDPEEFKLIREDCLAILKKNLEEILNGNISALPLIYSEDIFGIDGKKNKKHKSACNYCRFSMVCENNQMNVIDIDEITKGNAKK